MDIANIKLSKSSALYFLLIFVPIAVILELAHAEHMVLFVVAALGLIPLAKLIGDSTEHLAAYYGATLGSLLNVTFGNAAEIIIGVVSINAGLLDLVKASITGAILGNILLIFGLSIIAGGLKYKEQFFNRQNTGVQSSMLFLAVIGLAVPTVLAATTLKPVDVNNQIKIQFLSDSLAFLLLAVYIAGIIFTVFTHKHLFFAQPPVEVQTEMEGQKRLSLGRKETDGEGEAEGEWNHERWGKKKSFVLLGISMAGVVIVSEILVGSVEATTKEFGFGELFVGAIIIGIVGNAAEHTSAIILASKGKIDLSIGDCSWFWDSDCTFCGSNSCNSCIIMGKPVTLVFTIFELVSIFLAAIILNLIAHDGKSNWFEGLMLTVVYIIIAIGFFFIS